MTRQPPPRAKTNLAHVTAHNMVARHLLGEYRHLHTWQAVGAKFGLSRGMAYQVAIYGRKPRDPRLWRRLKRAVATDYDAWRAANMDKLLAIVKWAETPKAERVWPPKSAA